MIIYVAQTANIHILLDAQLITVFILTIFLITPQCIATFKDTWYTAINSCLLQTDDSNIKVID